MLLFFFFVPPLSLSPPILLRFRGFSISTSVRKGRRTRHAVLIIPQAITNFADMTSSILSELEEFHGKFYPRVYKGVVPVGPERISLESSYLEAWREDGWWGGVGSYCWEIIPNQSCQIKNFWKQFCVSLDMHWTLNPLCSATCSGAKTLFICMRYDIEVFVTDLLMGGRGGLKRWLIRQRLLRSF